MQRFVLIPALAAALMLGGCVGSNAYERQKLEEYDAGKPLPPIEDSGTRDSSFGD